MNTHHFPYTQIFILTCIALAVSISALLDIYTYKSTPYRSQSTTKVVNIPCDPVSPSPACFERSK